MVMTPNLGAAQARDCGPASRGGGAETSSYPAYLSLDTRLSPLVVNGENIEYDDIRHWNRRSPMADIDWTARAKNLLKSELKRKGVSYRELAEKLTAMGIPESERNIANKISRGGFTTTFLLQCLSAVGAVGLRLED